MTDSSFTNPVALLSNDGDRPGRAPFELTLRWDGGHDPMVTLRGELDLGTAGQLTDALDMLGEDGHRQVRLDLSALTFCDVRGLRTLLAADRHLAAAGSHLLLTGAPATLHRLCALTGLSDELLAGVPTQPTTCRHREDGHRPTP